MNRLIEIISNGVTYSLRSVIGGSAEERKLARTHISRRISLGWLSQFRSIITFSRNGFVWTGPSSCTITRTIFIDGQHQDVFIGSLAKWIKPHKRVIVNVGANIGDTALPLSRTGKHVLAIEPSPETFGRLQYNVQRNGLEQAITCVQCAISTTTGTANLVIADQPGNNELMGDQGHVGFEGQDRKRDVIAVPTVPLDDLLKSRQIGPDQVALVWSDTQGFESQVIESAPALWANGTPLWVEVWPRGLECHGGTDRFVELCRQYFTSFCSAKDIALPPKPVAGLESLVAELKRNDQYTDVLLIP